MSELNFKPAVQMEKTGETWRTTFFGLESEMMKMFSTNFNLPEIERFIITPVIANNDAGVNDFSVIAYFDTRDSRNIFSNRRKQTGGNKRGGFNIVDMLGTSGGKNSREYGTSNHFKQIMSSLVYTDNNGNPLINIQKVADNVVCLKLDPDRFFSLAMGIKFDDPMMYNILYIESIGNGNYNIEFKKGKSSNTPVRRGKSSGIDYARVQREEFNRMNGNRGRR